MRDYEIEQNDIHFMVNMFSYKSLQFNEWEQWKEYIKNEWIDSIFLFPIQTSSIDCV